MVDSSLPEARMELTAYNRFNYGIRQVIAKILHAVPGSPRLLAYAQKMLTHLVNIDTAYRQTHMFTEKMNGKQDAAQQFGSGFGYESSFRELEVAEHYRSQVEAGNLAAQKTESGALYDAMTTSISGILNGPPGVQKVLDFGVSYGHTDAQLAAKFPGVQFTGIDRSAMTKFYNEQFFKLPNLEFIAGDIFESLRGRDWQNALFFHMRTLTCLPQSFVENLYREAYRAGFSHVVGAEQCGISWQTGKPYDFSLQEQDSVVFRNYMYIHNYPGILKAAGFTVKECRLIKTKHPDPNFRLVLFTGER